MDMIKFEDKYGKEAMFQNIKGKYRKLYFFFFFQEIALSSIIGIESFKMNPSAEFPRAPHVFEMRQQNLIFYVGEDPFYGAQEGSLVVSTESGKGLEQARHWEHAIRQALMPVTPTTSVNQGTGVKRNA